MLIGIAIVPRHSKARTMSTRRSFRCCKNGLAVLFLANGTTTTPVPQAAAFGAALGPNGEYSCGLSGSFSLLFGKVVAGLTWERFYISFVSRTTGSPRNWRWTRSISEVFASFRVLLVAPWHILLHFYNRLFWLDLSGFAMFVQCPCW